MTIIACYHQDGETMSPLTQMGRATDGTLVATYSDGARVAVEAMGGRVPVLEFDVGDEPVVRLASGPEVVETPAERIEEAFNAWLSTAVCAVDPQGMAFRIHALGKAGMVLRDSDGDMDTFPHVHEGKLLSAVWVGEQLVGFAYGTGTPIARDNGTFVGAEIDRVRARLGIIESRLKGEWRIVAGEGERLGTDMTGLAVGGYVKIGVQPIHHMPGDYNAEWMWAQVKAIKGERITATLQNHPDCFAISLECGDVMHFDKRDVYAVEKPEIAKAA
jgi:hypothetical protein